MTDGSGPGSGRPPCRAESLPGGEGGQDQPAGEAGRREDDRTTDLEVAAGRVVTLLKELGPAVYSLTLLAAQFQQILGELIDEINALEAES